ncbi:sigma 54-interacting transcriptional regulator [Bradyrhizobium sp. 200]|uniref:sigma-54 interaction domain-containing protein n=1 Tax=Bradyrhizobium sp. 200 TaxID=2782665 RepID=UPI001FFE405B|nr:sigma 54-interacting transcriptional regulator [Bradyrhizobium sp. 200]UPJ53422.1 sigma 54-interacting transcriptional regulator [Bradyrhizobium sp. 200]
MRKNAFETAEAFQDSFARLNLLGDSPAFHEALRIIERFAAIDATVLIQGETGTGKELAARAVHYLSNRRDFPFIPINCAALPDTLVESELFGHEQGAFTDARRAHRGLVAQAENGTLFLDEVEAMSSRAQAVLLRFLQDYTYRPVGGRLIATGNVRVIASTNVDLEDLVRARQFRQDLLFRLNILSVTLPPLRQRGHDVVLLARHFLRRCQREYKTGATDFHPDAIEWLLLHRWPGNVRELQNLILREFILIDADVIDLRSARGETPTPIARPAESDCTFKTAKARAMAEFEKNYLGSLLARTRGNISLAARISQKDRSALNKLVKKYGLAAAQFRS